MLKIYLYKIFCYTSDHLDCHELSLDTMEVQTATVSSLTTKVRSTYGKMTTPNSYDLTVGNTYPHLCAEDKDGSAELIQLSLN